ncbi:ECF transporter S component [Massilibacterium senegalense]|uniref:ECF transporter S component n=1 Tax=Massilibacterium senegalense TaxID=1632858 RepID=UPI0007813748|nr:ECF transporter S component [Massilibacterium senegalense]
MSNKKWRIFFVFLVIPLIIMAGIVVFKDRNYNLISIMMAFLAFILVFLSFEKKDSQTRYLVILSIMVAISVIGRFIFTALPGFKPVTAIVVITAIYFGAEAGFLVGALSAIISNIYFGQGPWTPFQMFSWGMIGFIAGLPAVQTKLKKTKWMLVMYGIFAGVIFSLMMDIWTVLAVDRTFNATRYVAAILASFPFMIIYALSNIIFLLLTIKPFGEKLERIKMKYGL